MKSITLDKLMKIAIVVFVLIKLVMFVRPFFIGDSRDIKFKEQKMNDGVFFNYKDLGIDVSDLIDTDNGYYIPIESIADEINIEMEISEDGNTLTINDSLSESTINVDGKSNIDGYEADAYGKLMFKDGLAYVPLEFLESALFLYSYNVPENNAYEIYGNGREIYDIKQDDLQKPYLVVYSEEGRGEVFMGNKAQSDLTDSNKSYVDKVIRTWNSDIVVTNYNYSSNYPKVYYIRDGKVIDTTNELQSSYTSIGNNYYYESKVAFLCSMKTDIKGDTTENYIKIYDDESGRIIQALSPKDMYGYEVYDIQAVSEDFIVVGLLNTDLENDEFVHHYMTTVIDLRNLRAYPVYEYMEQKELFESADDYENVIDSITNRYAINSHIKFESMKINSDADTVLTFVGDVTDQYNNSYKEKIEINLNGENEFELKHIDEY